MSRKDYEFLQEEMQAGSLNPTQTNRAKILMSKYERENRTGSTLGLSSNLQAVGASITDPETQSAEIQDRNRRFLEMTDVRDDPLEIFSSISPGSRGSFSPETLERQHNADLQSPENQMRARGIETRNSRVGGTTVALLNTVKVPEDEEAFQKYEKRMTVALSAAIRQDIGQDAPVKHDEMSGEWLYLDPTTNRWTEVVAEGFNTADFSALIEDPMQAGVMAAEIAAAAGLAAATGGGSLVVSEGLLGAAGNAASEWLKNKRAQGLGFDVASGEGVGEAALLGGGLGVAGGAVVGRVTGLPDIPTARARKAAEQLDELPNPGGFFDRDAVERVVRISEIDPETAAVRLTPSEYLRVAPSTLRGGSTLKKEALAAVRKEGTAIDEAPMLIVNKVRDPETGLDALQVVGHEGRHRSLQMLDEGLDEDMVVRVVSKDGTPITGGRFLREGSEDFVETMGGRVISTDTAPFRPFKKPQQPLKLGQTGRGASQRGSLGTRPSTTTSIQKEAARQERLAEQEAFMAGEKPPAQVNRPKPSRPAKGPKQEIEEEQTLVRKFIKDDPDTTSGQQASALKEIMKRYNPLVTNRINRTRPRLEQLGDVDSAFELLKNGVWADVAKALPNFPVGGPVGLAAWLPTVVDRSIIKQLDQELGSVFAGPSVLGDKSLPRAVRRRLAKNERAGAAVRRDELDTTDIDPFDPRGTGGFSEERTDILGEHAGLTTADQGGPRGSGNVVGPRSAATGTGGRPIKTPGDPTAAATEADRVNDIIREELTVFGGPKRTALELYLLGGQSVTQIAKKFKMPRQSLVNAINRLEKNVEAVVDGKRARRKVPRREKPTPSGRVYREGLK
jgi:hypothetical protein